VHGAAGLPEHFSRFTELFREYEQIAATAGLSLLSFALRPILHEEFVDSVVVGIHDSSQMQALVDVISTQAPGVALDSIPLCSDVDLIDPRRWPDFR
jgi:aryl-alcohol dehydrogenase-like predicted oxidoreductase